MSRGPYTFPFPGKYSWGRIDQGTDFTGSGPIVAIGDAVILRNTSPGWPNGGAGPAGRGVLYRLLDGPNKGAIVFVYEGVVPTVKPGQHVKAGQQIAKFYPGSSIEIGFATASGSPLTPYNGAADGTPMPAGKKMHSFLSALEKGGSKLLHGGGGIGAAGKVTAGGGINVPSPADILNAVEGIPDAIVSAVFDTIGKEGARILLYVALVLGGGGLVAIGLGRAAGIKAETVKATAKAGAKAAGAAAI